MIRRLNTADARFHDQLDALLSWEARESAEVARTAADIVAEVRVDGDAALTRLTRRHDALNVVSVEDLEVDPDELGRSLERLPVADRDALRLAADRIRTYHERQPRGDFSYTDELGNVLGQRTTPLDSVGVYIPGGQAAYPSTVLMTVIPARVAGVCKVVATVPTPRGERNDHVLAAMAIAGVDRVFTIGGAQAIAALAFGTATVPRVDKIVGPGGVFVAAAKRLVFGPAGIDLIAGPSEILVIADGSVDPRWTALDLLSQAEHDSDAQAILVSPDSGCLDQVQAAVDNLVDTLPRAGIVRQSLRERGALIEVRDLAEACEVANRIAPEHLELAVQDPEALLPTIRHAGAIFLGAHAAEVFGDYVAGPSHVLPTFGTARYASPLGVPDFVKRTSIIGGHEASVQGLARVAANIADAEGLAAHGLAARARVAGYDDNRSS
ncbi:MAG: histidinol dehydrogenase [Gammaproteobacteria bacterium]|nr:histidinol dehydrogenase [Gammaproteobacteria bacterium]MYF30030.1 histidinol dehydrogenase [Gammaproteobacteria bacterium]MYK46310.1 histidinol dehydrogenase [Gammaproteobacteria bacterium]